MLPSVQEECLAFQQAYHLPDVMINIFGCWPAIDSKMFI
jgi:hypothetical protein